MQQGNELNGPAKVLAVEDCNKTNVILYWGAVWRSRAGGPAPAILTLATRGLC